MRLLAAVLGLTTLLSAQAKPVSESLVLTNVNVIDTRDGHLLARIPVGHGPHGLCVFPQPGRYSLGHTGVFR